MDDGKKLIDEAVAAINDADMLVVRAGTEPDEKGLHHAFVKMGPFTSQLMATFAANKMSQVMRKELGSHGNIMEGN